MSESSHSFSSNPRPSRSLLDVIGSVLNGILTVVRKMPMVVVFAVIAVILYLRQSNQPAESELPQFDNPAELQKEPQLPSDLPPGTNPSVWTCVHRVDAQLSNGLWADVYYGMEARLDGKAITIKVTEKWQELSEDKRQAVAKLVADTWIENSLALKLLNSKDEMEEVVIKRLSDDLTVAAWKPLTGVQLFKPEAGA